MKSIEPRRLMAAPGLSPRAVQLSCHIASRASSFGKFLIEREFWHGRHTQGRPVPGDRCQQSPPRVSRLASLIRHGCHEKNESSSTATLAGTVMACAAFSEESRMRFVNATKVHRESGAGKCQR